MDFLTKEEKAKLKEIWERDQVIDWGETDEYGGDRIEYDPECKVLLHTCSVFEGYFFDETVTVLREMGPSKTGSFKDLLDFIESNYIEIDLDELQEDDDDDSDDDDDDSRYEYYDDDDDDED